MRVIVNRKDALFNVPLGWGERGVINQKLDASHSYLSYLVLVKGGDNMEQMATHVAILTICMLIGKAVKLKPQLNDEAIPVVVGTAGGILGVVGMFIIPDFPATNILDAIAVGIVSGLAATGTHQVTKQLRK